MVVAINSLVEYNFASENAYDYLVCVDVEETLPNCYFFFLFKEKLIQFLSGVGTGLQYFQLIAI